MPEVLHSLRSLLCTAMNEVPHDRFLKFPSRSMLGTNIPIWMTEPGPVYVRKHVRDKYDPVVEEMDLLHANHNYVVVRSPEGREVTVSARNIAPTPAGPGEANESQSLSQSNKISFFRLERTDSGLHDLSGTKDLDNQPDLQTPLNWRSSRQRQPPIDHNTISLTILLCVCFLSPTYFRVCFFLQRNLHFLTSGSECHVIEPALCARVQY